ncbi:MAG: serine--tRNA ligase [Elusimicrobiota bacterium]
MIDINKIRNDISAVASRLSKRGDDYFSQLKKIKELDSSWRASLSSLEEIRHKKNIASDKIGELKRQGKDASSIISQMKEASQKEKELKEKVEDIKEKIRRSMLLIPNLPDETLQEKDKIIKQCGSEQEKDFEVLPHWEAGKILKIIDQQKASLLSGSQFALLSGNGARLERALINFMIDLHTEKHGYLEIMPPYLVKEHIMEGTGQFPKFRDESYITMRDRLCLIPTSEVPLVNLAREKILKKEQLPLKYLSYTPCFRREAGSHGLDTKGLIRNHQFNKVELVNITTPEESNKIHQELLKESERVLQLLELPYRVLLLGAKEMGFSASKTYDLEVWMPGEKKWREVSSCSNCTDFQSRRINSRYRDEKGEPRHTHTLNSSGLAVGRIFAAIVENFQTPEINVKIPQVLQSYMKNLKIIEREK